MMLGTWGVFVVLFYLDAFINRVLLIFTEFLQASMHDW